jgi:hypothetical protein
VVYYPARALVPLLRKKYRVGKGVPSVWRGFGMSSGQMVAAAIRGLLPMPLGRVSSELRRRELTELRPSMFRLWLAVWLCKIVRSAGVVIGMAS